MLDSILSLTLGVGVLGFVGATWVVHLIHAGNHGAALALAATVLALSVLAVLRVPLAQLLVVVGAALCGSAWAMGYGSWLMP